MEREFECIEDQIAYMAEVGCCDLKEAIIRGLFCSDFPLSRAGSFDLVLMSFFIVVPREGNTGQYPITKGSWKCLNDIQFEHNFSYDGEDYGGQSFALSDQIGLGDVLTLGYEALRDKLGLEWETAYDADVDNFQYGLTFMGSVSEEMDWERIPEPLASLAKKSRDPNFF